MRRWFSLFILAAVVAIAIIAMRSEAAADEVWQSDAYLQCVKRGDPGCKQDPASAAFAKDSLVLREEIYVTNIRVNLMMQYQSDIERYHLDDFWISGQSKGDCEDYALTKRRDLLALGFPANALRLAVVSVPHATTKDEVHAVLLVYTTVRTTDPYVLDNRATLPVSFTFARDIEKYQLIALQDAKGVWRSPPRRVVTAAH